MKVLLTPLDWGLGHASRSLALARQLQRQGHEIHWASSGPAAAMLRRELPPGTLVHDLPPYRVTYRSKNMYWNVARQALPWWRTIRAEHGAVAELVRKLAIEHIISDSRFGCYHPGVRSTFLTHQLHPITRFAPASAAYTWQLRHFDEFWVPDHAAHDRLSGKLSSPTGYQNVRYIGPLSRLTPTPGAPPFELLILLSGPEPMRTRLEKIILPQLPPLGIDYRLVRGLPGPIDGGSSTYDPSRKTYDYANTNVLSHLLTATKYVIARSGYSTLMDLRALNKPAILIPTPGQTEQVYLAQRAQLQRWALAVPHQDHLNLRRALSLLDMARIR